MPVPYMNPYYFQNNPAYQQAQYQNMQNPYEQVAQLRNQLNQQPPYNQMYQQTQQVQNIGLNGEIVDSIDVVNAKNVDLTGNITYYPKSDQTEIYTKQLQPDGRSKTLVYRLINEDSEPKQETSISMDTLNDLLNKMKEEMVLEIKALIPEPSSIKNVRQTKGGNSE